MLSLNHLRKKVLDLESKIDRVLELLGDQPKVSKPVDDNDQQETEKTKSRKGGAK